MSPSLPPYIFFLSHQVAAMLVLVCPRLYSEPVLKGKVVVSHGCCCSAAELHRQVVLKTSEVDSR